MAINCSKCPEREYYCDRVQKLREPPKMMKKPDIPILYINNVGDCRKS